MNRPKYLFRFLVGLLMMGFAAAFSQYRHPTAAQSLNDGAPALEILAHLNQWRVEFGLAPLKPNDTLHNLALQQATYLSLLPDIPGGNEMHTGEGGETLRERAAQYNWPTYGEGGLAAIAEVGWVGQVDSALEFWRGSSIHTETITNPGFREVGVAAVPHVWGHVFIVVLGSRPDVLPALVDPSGSQLYLTQDIFKYGIGNVPPIEVYLFDTDGRPLNNGQALEWTPMLPIPAEAGGQVFVLYQDGSSRSVAEVDLAQDRAVLP
jgi:uncharacterized protein YkwD